MIVNNKIKEFIDKSVNNSTFPSVSIGFIINNKGISNKSIICSEKHFNKQESKTIIKRTYFDLASLTKPFAVVLSLLSLIKNKKIYTNDKLVSFFSKNNISPVKCSITIEQLLSHSAGFPDHREYFKELIKVPVEKRKELLLRLLLDEPLVYEPGCNVIYSDLGYMLLGLIIEKISGQDLDYYFKKTIMEPVGLEDHIFFNPIDDNKYCSDEFAPVEYCSWRGKVLQGEVSDENCWALGGVGGHAGLYGDITGVLDLTELIMNIWLGKRNHPNINSRDLASFLKRRNTIKGNTWALGFDTPTPGRSSSGKYLSTTSVGHLGYTGTSFWIDPEREMAVVILSNRVHPSRDNELIREFRPAFHDRLVELLGVESI